MKQLGEEAGKYLGTGIYGGLQDSSKEANKIFAGFYERLKYQRDFNLISEEEYYLRLEKLRDRYFGKGTDNWIKYTKEIYKYQERIIEEQKKEEERLLKEQQKLQEKLLKEQEKERKRIQKEEEKRLKEEKTSITKMYDEVSEYAVKKLDVILKKQRKLAENLNSYGSFYNVNTVEINGVTDTYYSLHDLSSDIAALERYSQDANRIMERSKKLSVSDEATNYLLDNIKEMDTEDALQFMSALLYANDDMFSTYIQKAYEKFGLSEQTATKLYEEEFSKGVDEAYANMCETLEKAGYEIPEAFYTSGSISAQKFGEAFVLELDNQLGIIRGMIDEFYSGLEFSNNTVGDTYNTTNTSYNISASGVEDTVEQIRRMETVKRLAGIS